MQINRNNLYSTSFQAKIPSSLKDKILSNATAYGEKGLSDAKAQIKNVEKWGLPSTNLDLSMDLQNCKEFLGITNTTISKMYGAGFKQKASLYDTFMSLQEKDIFNAEEQLKKEVNTSKLDLIAKATKDNELMKQITGENCASATQLAKTIDRLSEEEVVNLRFGLDKSTKFENDKPLDFDF